MKIPTKELKILEVAQRANELAEKLVANRFTVEVKKILAKYKKNKFDEFCCGNGTYFFCKNGKVMEKEKLPRDMQEICDFLEENSYLENHIGSIKPGRL